MSDLKTRPADVAESGPDNSVRADGGGAIAVILACLLLLGVLAGAGVAGFFMYSRYVQRLAVELETADAERMRAEMAARDAEQMALARAAPAEAEIEQSQTPAPVAASPPVPALSPEEAFQAEIEPLNKAVDERPDDPKVWQDRGRVLQRWRKWGEAAEDYDRFLEINPNSVWMRLEAAVTRFAIGDYDAYLTHCKFAEERLAMKTQATIEHNRAARVLSLRPGAVANPDFLLVMAQEQPLKDPGKWWLVEPMLALQYRTGRYEDALKTLEEVRMLVGGPAQKAATEIWAAMTYHQLGRAEDAQRSLAMAQEVVAGGFAQPGSYNAGGDAVIMAMFLMDEAKALIEGETESAPAEAPATPRPESEP